MEKKEFIERYGKVAYKKWQQQKRDWNKEHPQEARERTRLWMLDHPEEVKANDKEKRKGGKYYGRQRKYFSTGIPHEKELVRRKHRNKWTLYKQIIAPESQIHHEWILNTSDFGGVALVGKDQHIHGFIDVIQILEGEITLFTEEEIKNRGGDK